MTRKAEGDDIATLIEELRVGSHLSTEQTATRLGMLLSESDADVDLLVSLLQSPQPSLRRAALLGCKGRTEMRLSSEMRRLIVDRVLEVRAALAQSAGTLPDSESVAILPVLARDEKRDVRLAAVKASYFNPVFYEMLADRLGCDADSDIRVQAAKAIHSLKTPGATINLFHSFLKDGHPDVRKTCAELIDERLTESIEAYEEFLPRESARIEEAHRMLKRYGLHRYPKFRDWLESKRSTEINVEELEEYGTDLTVLAEKNKLPRAFGMQKQVSEALRLLKGEERRSLIFVGEPGVGKTAVINELVYQLSMPENGSWRVLRVSPNEFLVGTKYIGEWNTKLAELVNLIRQPKRIILYVPNISELSGIGRYEKSEANVASALSTYIEDGSITIIGESTSEEYAQGLGAIPSLDRLFSKITIEPPPPEMTQAILKSVRDSGTSTLNDSLLDEIFELGEQYLHHVSAPGNCVSLLRDVLSAETEDTGPISRRTVLDTISRSTGIPANFLDDEIPLDLDATRTFLQDRVMGQHAAVEAVLDLLSSIKAGLTDRRKPFGVYLFVGPTGVGKTEMARSLAEFVFGNAERLERFDMSEFATYDSFERLIGVGRIKGLLTEAVRQKPFSVLLFDEIEKAHPTVFDLCLQIFDAGRLTDGQGRTISFRSSIVILTSNVGFSGSAAIPGFEKSSAEHAAAFRSVGEDHRIFKELSRVFRPEFLNRIDRTINFRQIGTEVAEQIARREVNAVLKRSGIARRKLSIDVDSSVISLLVKEGYSQKFGARPLKRAVESVFVQPLARAIASGNVSHETTLRITARDGYVEFEEIPLIGRSAES